MSRLDQLYERRETLYGNIAYSKGQISSLEDKISQLQEASATLETSIGELETTQNTANGLKIDESKWKGETKDTFVDQYATYVKNIKAFTTKTEDAKDEIDAEIQRVETSLATAEASLSHMESLMDSLNNDISKAKKG